MQSEKTLFCAIIGKPNVGKSTLLNYLVGAKIAITTAKPQTTRNRIMGVITKGAVQYVYLDTPGFHVPRTKLGEHMVKSVEESVSEVDCALFVTWAKDSFDEDEKKLLSELSASHTPVILVINKVDALKDKNAAAKASEALCSQYRFASAVNVSALTGENIDALERAVGAFAKDGPHLYDEDTLTDIPEKAIVAELIREKLLCNLRDELPHGCAVSVERFKERDDRPLIDIDAEIICEKASHKGMIIGKGGSMLKTIGTQARADIEDFLDCSVNLKLWVKVREDWRNSELFIKNFGL